MITNNFESVFTKNLIPVVDEERYGINMKVVQEFQESQKNRNHFQDRKAGSEIKHLVMHYTACAFSPAINTFTANIPDNRTSAHYLIAEKEGKQYQIDGGEVVSIVPEEKASWHAGRSSWKNQEFLNNTSIGIENVNLAKDLPGGKIKYENFDPKQIEMLGKLSQGIINEYKIAPVNVVGHADIAFWSSGKSDPGPLFPWGTLHSTYNVGAWAIPGDEEKYTAQQPLEQSLSIPFLSAQLKNYGYKIEEKSVIDLQLQKCVRAFQGHFSKNGEPEKCTGIPDMEDQTFIWRLNAKYDASTGHVRGV